MRLIIVHSTEVYVPLDINQSPFNVGLSIELPEFTREQVLDLANRHQLNWENQEVEQLMSMVGGHPLLVRLALYYIAKNDVTLTQVLQTATSDLGIYKEHLRRQLIILNEQAELFAAMKELLAANGSVKLQPLTKFKLQSLGLIKLQDDEIVPRCELYRRYFNEEIKSYN